MTQKVIKRNGEKKSNLMKTKIRSAIGRAFLEVHPND